MTGRGSLERLEGRLHRSGGGPGFVGTPRLPPDKRRARLLAWQGVDVVVDIGANEGQYGRRLRDAGFTGRVVSFEPFAEPFSALVATAEHDPNWDCHQLGLAERDGTGTLRKYRNSQANSLLPVREILDPANSDWEFGGTEPIQLARLDTVWPDLVAPAARAYLKVDVEGYELGVLEGTEEVLSNVRVVECELSIVPMNDGAPLFQEVIDYLRKRSFTLISLEEGHEDLTTGRMFQFDGIFGPVAI